MELRTNQAIRYSGHPFALAWPGKPYRSRGADGPVERVLFLDFDKALHPTTVREPEPWRMSSAISMLGWLPALVRAIQPHPDVGVVLHSSSLLTADDDGLDLLLGDLSPRLLGSTPPGRRYDSIQRWLGSNPGVTSYRIVDQAVEGYPRPLPAELIVYDPKSGVTGEDVAAALRSWLAS